MCRSGSSCVWRAFRIRRPPPRKGPGAPGESAGSIGYRTSRYRLTQQRQDVLLALVGLREHRSRRLAEDLRLGERGGLGRVVGILDPRTGVGQVGDVV